MITTNSQPQTWSNHVGIPLVQNLIGGMAASAIGAMATSIITPDTETIQLIAMVSGVLTSCGFTVVRFFGDDLGLLKSAFNAGSASRESEIERLSKLLYDAEQKLIAYESDPKIEIGSTRNNQQILDAVADAEKIVRWSYAGHSVSRAACGKRGVGQQAWKRANQVLVNAGIVADGHWIHSEESQALRALQAHFNKRSKQSQRGNVVTPY